VWRVLRLTKDLIEVLNMFVNVFREEKEKRMKDYSTREIIDYS